MNIIDSYKFNPQSSLFNGLVSLWDLNETTGSIAYDAAGNYDLTISGAVTSTYSLLGDNSRQFTNDSIYGSMSVTYPFTIMAWFRVYDSAAPTHNTIVSLAPAATTDTYVSIVVDTADGYVGTEASNGTTTYTKKSFGTVTYQWFMVTLICNSNSDRKTYIGANGPYSSGLYDTINLGTVTRISLGKDADDSKTGYIVGGHIDQAGVWDRALTSAEVATLYNGGSGLPYANW